MPLWCIATRSRDNYVPDNCLSECVMRSLVSHTCKIHVGVHSFPILYMCVSAGAPFAWQVHTIYEQWDLVESSRAPRWARRKPHLVKATRDEDDRRYDRSNNLWPLINYGKLVEHKRHVMSKTVDLDICNYCLTPSNIVSIWTKNARGS